MAKQIPPLEQAIFLEKLLETRLTNIFGSLLQIYREVQNSHLEPQYHRLIQTLDHIPKEHLSFLHQKIEEMQYLARQPKPEPVVIEVTPPTAGPESLRDILGRIPTSVLLGILEERREHELRKTISALTDVIAAIAPQARPALNEALAQQFRRGVELPLEKPIARKPKVIVVGPTKEQFQMLVQNLGDVATDRIELQWLDHDKQTPEERFKANIVFATRFIRHQVWELAIKANGSHNVIKLQGDGISTLAQRIRDYASTVRVL